MIDRIKKHLEDRKSITEELTKIMGYCDIDSPIDMDFIDKNGKFVTVMHYISK